MPNCSWCKKVLALNHPQYTDLFGYLFCFECYTCKPEDHKRLAEFAEYEEEGDGASHA